jgi:hypothetical protein
MSRSYRDQFSARKQAILIMCFLCFPQFLQENCQYRPRSLAYISWSAHNENSVSHSSLTTCAVKKTSLYELRKHRIKMFVPYNLRYKFLDSNETWNLWIVETVTISRRIMLHGVRWLVALAIFMSALYTYPHLLGGKTFSGKYSDIRMMNLRVACNYIARIFVQIACRW